MPILYGSALLSLILNGGIFGFFLAWICSTMWGLDEADPAVAIQAMQAMNASVRNVVFAPFFFGTPLALLATALLAYLFRQKSSAILFTTAGIVYLSGGMILTFAVNVPMNEALALISVPENSVAAQKIWQDYSGPWQFWNTIRTTFSGIALALTGGAIWALNGRTSQQLENPSLA